MAYTTPSMSLTAWNQVTDYYSHTALESNWTAIDQHNHSSGQGVQIGTGGIANGAITSSKLGFGVVQFSEGLASALPSTSSVAVGAVYYATDTGRFYQSNGTVWGVVMIAGPWVNLTLNSGWTTSSGFYTPAYQVIGLTVRLRGATQGSGSSTTIATLPAGVRPSQEVVYSLSPNLIYITSSGVITAGVASDAALLDGCAPFDIV